MPRATETGPGQAHTAPEVPRLGRPPRVSASQIAEAALAIGLDRATIRNVAEKLGMSVPGLYHHVRSREDLLAMAAAHSLGSLPIPPDEGLRWTEWLEHYARFVYDALVAQPDLLGQIVAGTVNTVRLAQHLERFFEVLARHGFEPEEAYATYRRLTAATHGAAAAEVGRRSARVEGHPFETDLALAVRALGRDTVPRVAAFVRSGWHDEVDHFDVVRLVIAALDVQRGPRPGPTSRRPGGNVAG